MQTPAFGDLMGGLTIAGGIAAALYKRKSTGETSIVDVFRCSGSRRGR